MRDASGFARAQAIFREALHARARGLGQWRLTNRPLQAAICDPNLDESATAGRVVAEYARALAENVESVDAAAAAVRTA